MELKKRINNKMLIKLISVPNALYIMMRKREK